VSSLSVQKILSRAILLNAIPLSAIQLDSFVIACKRVNINAVKDVIESSREVCNYIRHESTVKLLSEQLQVELKPSSELYAYRHGDVLIIVALKRPQRGIEVTQISLEDLDIAMCVVQELPIPAQ
jgi:Domain of unknown function (DUF1874).